MALFVRLTTKLRTINPNKFNILGIQLQYSDAEGGRDQHFSTNPKVLQLLAVTTNSSLYPERSVLRTSGRPSTGHLFGCPDKLIILRPIKPLLFKLLPYSRELVKYFNPYPTAFPYGNGMVLHFYQQQESSTTKTVHRVINKGLKTYV